MHINIVYIMDSMTVRPLAKPLWFHMIQCDSLSEFLASENAAKWLEVTQFERLA